MKGFTPFGGSSPKTCCHQSLQCGLRTSGFDPPSCHLPVMLFPPAQDFLEAELDVKRGLCLQPENADLHVLSKRLKVREWWGGGRGEILKSRLAHF